MAYEGLFRLVQARALVSVVDVADPAGIRVTVEIERSRRSSRRHKWQEDKSS
jgi:hypothetical protein